jgi:hypothetical protein
MPMHMARPPSRNDRNISRGRSFSISSRSTANSLGFRAARNASPKNAAFMAAAPAWSSPRVPHGALASSSHGERRVNLVRRAGGLRISRDLHMCLRGMGRCGRAACHVHPDRRLSCGRY